MTAIDKLAWITIKNRKALLARSYGKSLFYIPGGKREPGESDAIALHREINEELSIELVTSSMQAIGIFTAQADDKQANIQVTLSCYHADYDGEIKAAAEIEETQWLDARDLALVSKASQLVMQHLKNTLKLID